MAAIRRAATAKKKLLTAEDLFHLPDDDRFYELLDGVLIEMSPPGAEHGAIMTNVAVALAIHVREGGLGVVLSGDPGIILRRNPDRVRAPDVCFIASGRLPAGRLPTAYTDVVPDLVVEVVSPGDTAAELEQKVEEWLRAGVRLVWAVYPSTRSVVAYQGLESARVYSEGETLTGAPVLPDFATSISSLFA